VSEKEPTGDYSDFCAYCGHELTNRPDRIWECMASDEGLVASGNYCRNGKCEQRAERESADVALYLRHRQQTDDKWES
jgi:hypothetical protein